MTILRMSFAGKAMKVESKMAGDKPLLEVSLCKKVKGRNGGEDTFTWIRATIWQPPEFMVAKLVKGCFVAGSGEFTSRSFDGKEGKQTAMEVRCTSFDIEVGESVGGDGEAAPRPSVAPSRASGPSRPAAAPLSDDEPPF